MLENGKLSSRTAAFSLTTGLSVSFGQLGKANGEQRVLIDCGLTYPSILRCSHKFLRIVLLDYVPIVACHCLIILRTTRIILLHRFCLT